MPTLRRDVTALRSQGFVIRVSQSCMICEAVPDSHSVWEQPAFGVAYLRRYELFHYIQSHQGVSRKELIGYLKRISSPPGGRTADYSFQEGASGRTDVSRSLDRHLQLLLQEGLIRKERTGRAIRFVTPPNASFDLRRTGVASRNRISEMLKTLQGNMPEPARQQLVSFFTGRTRETERQPATAKGEPIGSPSEYPMETISSSGKSPKATIAADEAALMRSVKLEVLRGWMQAILAKKQVRLMMITGAEVTGFPAALFLTGDPPGLTGMLYAGGAEQLQPIRLERVQNLFPEERMATSTECNHMEALVRKGVNQALHSHSVQYEPPVAVCVQFTRDPKPGERRHLDRVSGGEGKWERVDALWVWQGTVVDPTGLMRWIRGFGSDVVVVSPFWMARRLRRTAYQVQFMYAEQV